MSASAEPRTGQSPGARGRAAHPEPAGPPAPAGHADPGGDPGHSGQLVRTGVLWNLAQYGGGKAVTFVSTIVLARLLAPSAFGLVALGMLAINLFDRLKDLGVGQALVQYPGRSDRLAPTGATLTALTSAVLSLACLVAAPALAVLLGDARLTPIVRALALSLLVSGLAVLPDSMLRRQLRFRERTRPEMSGVAVKAALSVGLALVGLGAWSLVWGQVAGSVCTSAGYWLAYRRRRGGGRLFGWSADVARRLLRFGTSLSGVALLALVLDNLDYFFVGRRLGATELGYYTMAFRLPEMFVVSTCVVVGQVLYSSFSRLQQDLPALRDRYLSASAAVATVTVPVGLGLAAAAPDIVAVVMGDAFAPAAPLLRLLGIYGAVYSLSFHAGEVYKALGRAQLLLRLSAVRLVVFAPVLWWAAGISTVAVAAAFLGLHALFTLVRLALVRHVLRLRLRQQWRALWPSLTAGAVLVAGVAGAGAVLPDQLPALVRLALLVGLGCGLYAGMLRLVDPGSLRRGLALLRRTGGGSGSG